METLYKLSGDESNVGLSLETWRQEFTLSKIAYEWEIPEFDDYGNPREPYEYADFDEFKRDLYPVRYRVRKATCSTVIYEGNCLAEADRCYTERIRKDCKEHYGNDWAKFEADEDSEYVFEELLDDSWEEIYNDGR